MTKGTRTEIGISGKRARWSRIVAGLALASTAFGGCASKDGEQAVGPQQCGAPSCCTELSVEDADIEAYRLEGFVFVHARLHQVGLATEAYWAGAATASTNISDSVACSTPRTDKAQATSVLTCAAATPKQDVACGSPIAVTLQLNADTFAAYDSASQVCGGTRPGQTLHFTTKLSCPECGRGKPCDPRATVECRQSSLASNGETGELPCQCLSDANSTTGYWNCAEF